MRKNYVLKVMPLLDLYQEFIKNEPSNNDVFSRVKFLDTSLKSDEIMFCFFDDKKIIAAIALEMSETNNRIFNNKYISVDKDYRNLGFAKNLIEQQFIYIKNKDGILINSKYSPEGNQYIKKYINLYSELYSVPLYEHDIEPKQILPLIFQPTIDCTLLVSPPGGGKSTWIKNNTLIDRNVFDDISLNKNALNEISQLMKEKENIIIADINFCDYQILKKAWQTLIKLGNENKINIKFNNILLVGEKEDYINNIKSRNDGRSVMMSLDRFYPHIKNLESNQMLGDMEVIKVYKKNIQLINKKKNVQ